MIATQCGNCGAKYQVADGLAGRSLRCQKCGFAFSVSPTGPIRPAETHEAASSSDFGLDSGSPAGDYGLGEPPAASSPGLGLPPAIPGAAVPLRRPQASKGQPTTFAEGVKRQWWYPLALAAVGINVLLFAVALLFVLTRGSEPDATIAEDDPVNRQPDGQSDRFTETDASPPAERQVPSFRPPHRQPDESSDSGKGPSSLSPTSTAGADRLWERDYYHAVAADPRGKYLITSRGKRPETMNESVIEIWDYSTGRRLAQWDVDISVYEVCLSGGGHFAGLAGVIDTDTDSALMQVWDVQSETKIYEGQNVGIVSRVQVTAGGEFAYASGQFLKPRECLKADLRAKAALTPLPNINSKPVHEVSLTETTDPQIRVVKDNRKRVVHYWNRGKSVHSRTVPEDFSQIATSADGTLTVVASLDEVMFWKWGSEEEPTRLVLERPAPNRAVVSALTVNGNGSLIAVRLEAESEATGMVVIDRPAKVVRWLSGVYWDAPVIGSDDSLLALKLPNELFDLSLRSEDLKKLFYQRRLTRFQLDDIQSQSWFELPQRAISDLATSNGEPVTPGTPEQPIGRTKLKASDFAVLSGGKAFARIPETFRKESNSIRIHDSDTGELITTWTGPQQLAGIKSSPAGDRLFTWWRETSDEENETAVEADPDSREEAITSPFFGVVIDPTNGKELSRVRMPRGIREVFCWSGDKSIILHCRGPQGYGLHAIDTETGELRQPVGHRNETYASLMAVCPGQQDSDQLVVLYQERRDSGFVSLLDWLVDGRKRSLEFTGRYSGLAGAREADVVVVANDDSFRIVTSENQGTEPIRYRTAPPEFAIKPVVAVSSDGKLVSISAIPTPLLIYDVSSGVFMQCKKENSFAERLFFLPDREIVTIGHALQFFHIESDFRPYTVSQ